MNPFAGSLPKQHIADWFDMESHLGLIARVGIRVKRLHTIY